MRQAPRRGCLEIVPVCVPVPVPETRMVSGFLVFIWRPDWLKFFVARLLLSFLCAIESGTGAGTGLRPGHGHEFSLETAEPSRFSPPEPGGLSVQISGLYPSLPFLLQRSFRASYRTESGQRSSAVRIPRSSRSSPVSMRGRRMNTSTQFPSSIS